ncbi:uncharacterized protein LOC110828984 [Zootermopsis nevadensis]|uniref:uncharacterized protein LOC110828984 n=1 Tax=Zootermopsis nevadensis TaxID=136037 RepID=UPI000B8E6BD1|nr:uncharacterized protein LOC110828984 [Zootermopsis nevadensis]
MLTAVFLWASLVGLTVHGAPTTINAHPVSPNDTENKDRIEVQPEQDENEVLIDGEKLPEDKSSEPPKRAFNQMRAETGGLFPGFHQSGDPTLILGGFSLITMPMPGANGFLQNILPLLQKFPAPTQLLSG